jgi:hypothetical protein
MIAQRGSDDHRGACPRGASPLGFCTLSGDGCVAGVSDAKYSRVGEASRLVSGSRAGMKAERGGFFGEPIRASQDILIRSRPPALRAMSAGGLAFAKQA